MKAEILEIITQHKFNHISSEQAVSELLDLSAVINWVAFDFYKLETRPPKYGKYLITRKDGKIHWETWNGADGLITITKFDIGQKLSHLVYNVLCMKRGGIETT